MFIKKICFVHVFKFLSKVDLLVFGLDPMYEDGFTEMDLLKLCEYGPRSKGRSLSLSHRCILDLKLLP